MFGVLVLFLNIFFLLGAIVLDLINGVPNWLSYKGKIVRNGKVQLKFGLLAAKCRDFEK